MVEVKRFAGRHLVLFQCLLLVIFGGLLYGNTLSVPPYLDDNSNIFDNKTVHYLPAAATHLFALRGLTTLSFALNYQFGGANLAGFHLVNITIHLASGCLVLLLLRLVFPSRAWLPLMGALIFVAHPLQTGAVTYLVQRMTSLSALFFLLATYLFARARGFTLSMQPFRHPRHLTCYAGALLAGALAILAKENAVVLPLALLLFSSLPGQDAEQCQRARLKYLAPFLLVPLVVVTVHVLIPLFSGKSLTALGSTTTLVSLDGNAPLPYLFTQFQVLWIYIRLLFIPFGQALDHGYPVSPELLNLKSLSGLCGLLLLAVLTVRMRRRQPVIACGICWFFLTLAVESSVIPLDPLFEHRLYLPMFGFVMCLLAITTLLPRPKLGAAFLAGVVLMLAVLTWQRNALWNDPVAFYQDNLQRSPNNERVIVNLARISILAGNFAEAEKLLHRSLEINPIYIPTYEQFFDLYLSQGLVEEAIASHKKALSYKDKMTDRALSFIYNDLGYAYALKGDLDTSIAMFIKSISLDEASATYYNLSQAYYRRGAYDQSEATLRKSLTLNRFNSEAHALLAELMNRQGRTDEARLHKEAAMRFQR